MVATRREGEGGGSEGGGGEGGGGDGDGGGGDGAAAARARAAATRARASCEFFLLRIRTQPWVLCRISTMSDGTGPWSFLAVADEDRMKCHHVIFCGTLNARVASLHRFLDLMEGANYAPLLRRTLVSWNTK